MTGWRGILGAGLAGIALAGCGGSAGGTRSGVSPTTPPPAITTAHRVPAVGPGVLALRRALSAQLRKARPAAAALVYDITAHRPLFALRAGLRLPPASVGKLYTSLAVLTDLGPSERLQTTVLGTGQLGAGGVWRGSLYLRGGGDPTFGATAFNRHWEEGYGPSPDQLAAQLSARGIRRVSGRVFGDASLFDSAPGGPATGLAADVPDIGGQLSGLTYNHGMASPRLSPGAFAARALALALRRRRIRVRPAPFTATTPPGARSLATVTSPPMSVLLRLTDVPSDDFFAEMLTKQLGARFGGGGTTAAGVAVIRRAVSASGVHPTIVDGSGLSRLNRSSVAEVVALLRSLWSTPVSRELRTALPLVGVNGTVRRLAVHTPAQGRCLAKTGTLNFVTNLAGYCHSHGEHVLAFALFLDGPPNPKGMVLLGRMVAAIARY